MVKDNTQKVAGTPDEQINTGRRWAFRVGGAAVLAAAGFTTSAGDANAQSDLARAFEKAQAEALKAAKAAKAAQNPPPVTIGKPAPSSGQKIAPQSLPRSGAAVDLETDEPLRHNANAYSAYQTMSRLIIPEPTPFKIITNTMSSTESSQIDNYNIRTDRANKAARLKALSNFSKLYYEKRTSSELEEIRPKFEAAIDAIKGLDETAQKEVLGRLVRDIKELRSNIDSSVSDVTTLFQALFNIFPQARHVIVKYSSRDTLGAHHTQSNQYDFAAELKVKVGNVAQYLTDNSVMRFTSGVTAVDVNAVADPVDGKIVQRMLGTDSQQSAGAGRGG